jgi:hypothetical protein
MPASLLRTKPETGKIPGVESNFPGRLSYFQVLFLAFTFWFASDIMSWAFSKGGPPPVLSYLAFLSFGAFVLLIKILQGVAWIDGPAWVRTRSILIWSYGFFIWTLLSFLLSSQSAVAEQRTITQIEMTLILCGFVLWLLNNHLHRPLGYISLFLHSPMLLAGLLGCISIQPYRGSCLSLQ